MNDSRTAPQPDVPLTPDLADRPTPPGPRLGLGPFGIALRALTAIVILLGANLVASLLVSLVTVVTGSADLMSVASPARLGVGIALQVLILTLVVLAVHGWMRWVERTPIRSAGWRWGRRSALWLLLGVVAAAGSLLAVTLVLPKSGPVLESGSVIGDGPATLGSVALVIAYTLGLAFLQQGIPEELLFRGWLLWRLRDRPVIAVIVTTLTFTVIHLLSNGGQQSALERVLYLAVPFGFALLAVGLVLWTGSLWAAAGVHGGFHVGNAIAAVALPQVEAVLSWVAVGGLHAVLGLVLVVTGLRRGKRLLAGTD